MDINTPHATFNKQTNIIGGKGNVIANTCLKWHIDKDRIAYDIQPVLVAAQDHPEVRPAVEFYAKQQDIYATVLFHINRQNRYGSDIRIAHGFILSDMDEHLINWWPIGPTYKSVGILLECIPYVATLDDKQRYMWDSMKERYYARYDLQG